jgi:beta-ureidopropionase / N-carbamoyl-L-amino-acid hydrolase
MKNIRINMARLKQDILELAEIGATPQGGVSRPSFSADDLKARTWLKDKISCAGLCFGQDGAGNLFGRMEGRGPVVMAGSHIDTVVNGGKYDGSIGVLAALECLRRINEEKIPHTKPLEMVSFTDEEGNLVGDFLGSRAFTGNLDRDILEHEKTQFGPPLAEILENTEFSLDSILEAHQKRPDIHAFLEIHIEQGPVLEMEDKPIGIVEKIAGKNYWTCAFIGNPSHAGTTPFELRHDAFLGLSDFALKSTHFVATEHYGSMMTIGRAHLRPGSFSIVPGRADFSLDFRSTSRETLDVLSRRLVEIAVNTAESRGLEFRYKTMDSTQPVSIPEQTLRLLKDQCQRLDIPYMTLASGAGHDAQIMASCTDAGMIFIPCEDGISHAPEENISWNDLEQAANLLLHALLTLAE